MEIYGSYYYLDGNLHHAGPDDEFPSGEVSFYEVIRTVKGIPLFFDDHMERLTRGIATRYEPDPGMTEKIREGLEALAGKELFHEINVRITVVYTGQEYTLHICYIPSSYPTGDMIANGVHLILYRAERLDPGVKLLNNRLRLSVNEALKKKNAYEALLVDHEGYITEGSRSNVFFVTPDGKIRTAPDRMVLGGITRKYVTEICLKERIELAFEPVRVNDMGSFRSVFITGTSPMVLPVRSIENRMFEPVSHLTEKLRLLYSSMAEESIRKYAWQRNRD